MKAIVIYHSQTGFTKRYAQWLSEASDADLMELSEAKKKGADALSAYDAIIFGGWACAGGISRLSWFKSNMGSWEGRKLIVYCVGASPADSPNVEPALRQNFTESELEKVNVFYCPGGLDYDKMPLPSKLMMKMFLGTLKAKKHKTEVEQEMVKMISASYDIADKKYIMPILDCLKGETV